MVVLDRQHPRAELRVTLDPLSTLAGRVTDEVSGAPALVGLVVAERRSREEPFRRGAELQADGSYLIEGLPPGEYQVRVLAQGYLTAFYTGGARNGLVAVGVGDRIEGVDVAVSEGLGISGQVTDSGGSPLGGAMLLAWPVVGEGRRQAAETAEDGTYRLTGLTPGSYLMTAAAQGYGRVFYDGVESRDEATSVRVGLEDEPSGVNFQLKPVGTIFGQVTARTGGAPVAGALVVAEPRAGGKRRQARTGEDGAYVISDLPTADYLVRARAEGYAVQYYPDALSRTDANPVRVLSDAHTTGIDLALGRLGTVSGKVSDREENPVSGARVVLRERSERVVPPPARGRPEGEARSDRGRDLSPLAALTAVTEDGVFQIKGVPPGTYVLQAAGTGFARRFYLDEEGTGPAQISVGIEEEVTGIEVILPRLGVISGQVRAVDDAVLEKIEVVAEPVRVPQPAIPAPLSGEVTAVAGSALVGVEAPPRAVPLPGNPGRVPVRRGFRAEVLDAEEGTYRIIGLPEGVYRVRASARGYITSWYSDADSARAAERLQVGLDQEVPKVDFVLTRGGLISGYVLTDGTGRPIPRAVVTAQKLGKPEVFRTQTGRTGAFELSGLPDGRYLLRAEAKGFVGEFYEDTPKPEQAVPIEIGAEKTFADLLLGLAQRSPADFDGDGEVGFADLILFLRQMMGKSQGYTDAHFDLNRDGQIDFQDFLVMVRLITGAGKVTGESGALVWKRLEGAADEVVVGLEAQLLPASRGYVLRVVYDPMEAEYLGTKKRPEGLFEDGAFLVHHDKSGAVLIAGGHLEDERQHPIEQGDGPLVQLRFRPVGKAIGVTLQVQRAMVITDEGAFIPLHMPRVERLELAPRAFRLLQNVPNPFNPVTTIAFELPTETRVDLAVYNLVGQRVRTLVQEVRQAGRYQVVWDSRDGFGRSVSSGVYFYHLSAGEFGTTRRMLLLR